MYNGYTLYTMYNNMDDNILVMNKILKQLIKDTAVLSLVPKVFGRIFNGIWRHDSGTMDAEMIR